MKRLLEVYTEASDDKNMMVTTKWNCADYGEIAAVLTSILNDIYDDEKMTFIFNDIIDRFNDEEELFKKAVS